MERNERKAAGDSRFFTSWESFSRTTKDIWKVFAKSFVK